MITKNFVIGKRRTKYFANVTKPILIRYLYNYYIFATECL